LQQLLDREPGVSGVFGPAQQPEQLANMALTISKDGRAARYVVVLRDDPLSGPGIDTVSRLEDRMPTLMRRAALHGAQASFAGDTALVAETINRTVSDFARIGAVILAVDLLLLILLLRAVVAPLYLLATSVLALIASIGLTVLVFQVLLKRPDLTYYVPIAGAVLLVSLGSDYNIFVVGRIWEEARTHPIREAVAVGSRRATRAVTLAGITLAASFGLLAIVPLTPFRELAFLLGAGVLIDSFLVRSVLAPSLIALFGRTSTWPSRSFGRAVSLPREEAAS
jgi:RND superfamily putative drug exporter